VPMTNAELLQAMNTRMPPTSALLGRKVLAIDPEAGTVRMSFEGRREYCNPMGNVQGGFIAAMLDDCAAIAAIAKSGLRIAIPTLELKVSYFAPAKVGTLFAEGRCLRLGQRVAFMEADLLDGDGKLLARMTTTGLPIPIPDNALMVETS